MKPLILQQIRIAKYRMRCARTEFKYQLALEELLDLEAELNLY